MIHHIVMLKFKPGIDEEQIDELAAMLDELPNKIIEIHLYEFGRDMLNTDRSYDFALVSLFANVQALGRYQKHPEHLRVLEKIDALCEDVKTVDFEDTGFANGDRDENPWAEDPFKRLGS
jgi:quinol monooxygenase YgiN